jgi:hypothetical protein
LLGCTLRFDAHLVKPIVLSQLQETLDSVLDEACGLSTGLSQDAELSRGAFLAPTARTNDKLARARRGMGALLIVPPVILAGGM